MACKKEGVPFSGTPKQEAALKKVIAELKDTKGALMPIMQQAQEIYGYLPIEVQTMISDETGIPLEKIYGIATFYTQFALQPKGKYQISVCLGTACYVKGSAAIFSKLEELLGITNGQCTPDDYEYGGKLFLKGKARRRHCLFVHRICDTGAESRIGENECDDEGRHPDAG